MTNTDFRYQLDSPRLTGRRQQKTTCPQCMRTRCFVRYVDTHNQCRYLDGRVGRCDHEQSCGYHYRPSEYFRDHPWMAERDWRQQPHKPSPQPLPPKPLVPLPAELVRAAHSPHSVFWQWMTHHVAPTLGVSHATMHQIYDDYRIGATSMGNVVFWQIDHQGRVRTGQIMNYGTNGNRGRYTTWVHTILEQQNRLPEGYHLRQCLFGEHLLGHRPDAHICLVESQKTALIMAACHPDYLWLATCGCGGLTPERLACLAGRRLTIFPDSGCYGKWSGKMRHIPGIAYNIDDRMEQYPPNTDLADLILGRV